MFHFNIVSYFSFIIYILLSYFIIFMFLFIMSFYHIFIIIVSLLSYFILFFILLFMFFLSILSQAHLGLIQPSSRLGPTNRPRPSGWPSLLPGRSAKPPIGLQGPRTAYPQSNQPAWPSRPSHACPGPCPFVPARQLQQTDENNCLPSCHGFLPRPQPTNQLICHLQCSDKPSPHLSHPLPAKPTQLLCRLSFTSPATVLHATCRLTTLPACTKGAPDQRSMTSHVAFASLVSCSCVVSHQRLLVCSK